MLFLSPFSRRWQHIIYIKNLDTNERYDFDDENAILYIHDLGVIPNEITTSKGVNQIGESMIGRSLNKRDWMPTGCLTADTEAQMRDKRRKTTRFFNPLNSFEFVKDDLAIGFNLQSSVDYDDDYKTNTEHLLTFNLSLISTDPCYRALSPLVAYVARWIPTFKMPFSLPMKFGIREPSVIANVFNPGDIECGMTIQFQASGPVQNPGLVDVDSPDKFFCFKSMIMNLGDLITVDTIKKTVSLTRLGIQTDVFNDIDMTSSFLNLSPGDNLMKYTADMNINSLNVSIIYTPLYIE